MVVLLLSSSPPPPPPQNHRETKSAKGPREGRRNNQRSVDRTAELSMMYGPNFTSKEEQVEQVGLDRCIQGRSKSKIVGGGKRGTYLIIHQSHALDKSSFKEIKLICLYIQKALYKIKSGRGEGVHKVSPHRTAPHSNTRPAAAARRSVTLISPRPRARSRMMRIIALLLHHSVSPPRRAHAPPRDQLRPRSRRP